MNSSESLEALRDCALRLRGKRDQLKEEYREGRRKLRDLREEAARCDKALVVAQEVAKQTQQELEYKISDIVTAALESVFPDPYTFRVIFEIKRGKTEARLVFERDGEEIDPMTAAGGGVVDVAAFALRLSCYLIQRPRKSPVMILDEPFRFVSKGFQPMVAELLLELSDKLGIQFIIVTHEEELKIGNLVLKEIDA